MVTEHFLYIINNISDIKIIGFDQNITDNSIKDASFERDRILNNAILKSIPTETDIFSMNFKSPIMIESPEFFMILDKMYNRYVAAINKVGIDLKDICFIFEENCESYKEWDWDFVLNRIYSCLKDVPIFVNDEYYYNIFKRNGFLVWRYWPGHLVAPIYEINPNFELRLDDIDKTFCRLSNSRHDHNYYIHKFLTESGLLENTHWSYSNCGYHEFYYNFNRFLDLNESKYKELPERYQPGPSFAPNMSLKSLDPHIKSAVTINCETVFHGHGPCYSEKLIKCANLARPFIEVSSPHTLKDLRKWGFESFPDLVDESYDDIEDPYERIEHICGEIHRLSKIPLQHFKDYIKKNEEKLRHNFEVGQRMAQSVFDQDYKGLILP